MAVAERGSFMWFLFSITSFLISIKVMNDFEGYATTVFGGTGAAAMMLAIILFRQEQRELLLNPMKAIEREVHDDAIASGPPPGVSQARLVSRSKKLSKSNSMKTIALPSLP